MLQYLRSGSKSLQGGTLLLTPLRGVDGAVYAVAQGPISVGGFAAGRCWSSRPEKSSNGGETHSGGGDCRAKHEYQPQGRPDHHHPTVPTLPPLSFAQTINRATGQGAASPISGTIAVDIPSAWQGAVVDLVARLESLEDDP